MSTRFPPIIPCFPQGSFAARFSPVCSCCLPRDRRGQIAPLDASLYRIFLRDGSTIVSYGEFARVSDRVVVSLPVGGGRMPRTFIC
jgi:hypothetical protein